MENIFFNKLNDLDESVRLDALKKLIESEKKTLQNPHYVNNHVHTTYSFSPYSPTKAAYLAYKSGLSTVGIMDHDSIGGAKEFIRAGEIIGIPTTIGLETRISLKGSPFENRLINNPDQKGVAYVALHGIPHFKIDELSSFFEPYRQKRNVRNKLMTDKINEFFKDMDIKIDFENDIVNYSLDSSGGSITERTLCFVLALKIIQKFGKGQGTVDFLEKTLKLSLSAKIKDFLLDVNNIHYEYDLLGILKGNVVSKFYIDATDECPAYKDFLSLGKKIGAVIAYAYLGDVEESPTGDKKAQKFEDDYLEELFTFLKKEGFNAIAYMPTRNSGKQLERLRALCQKEQFFEISGEDINSSRQSFICPQLANPEFSQLIPATWALIGHEISATKHGIEEGMFSEKTIKSTPSLQERITKFAKIAQTHYKKV